MAKKCKICGELNPNPLAMVCGWKHAIEYVRISKEKKQAKEVRKSRERLKTRGEWLKDAQASFNAYIRERDKDLPCISCGRFHQGQWHAGHYRPTSIASALRFSEDNVHKQCQPCNTHLHGNIIEYRINLGKKIGIDKLDWLEGVHESVKYSIEDLKRIKSIYKQKLKELKNEKANCGEAQNV